MTDADDTDDVTPYALTPADQLRKLRYTLSPTLFVNEDSTVNDLLWQLVLEQRATRCWVTVLVLATVVPLVLILAGALVS
jgi:hypothetical protein